MSLPRLIIKALEIILPHDLHHLIGDMEEELKLNTRTLGKIKARVLFLRQLFISTPYFIFQSLIWNTLMISNYLKIAWRNLKKQFSFSTINILGLATSMSVSLLIIVFIIDQKSYDHFHEKSDQIYRVTTDFKSPSNEEADVYASSPATLGPLLKEQFPEVVEQVDLRNDFGGEFQYEDKVIPLSGIYTSPSFFDVFDFKLTKGSSISALNDPGSLILTKEAAERLFSSEDPIGKTITALGDRDYVVTGIIESVKQTHFKFEAVASYSTLTSNTKTQNILNDWKSSIYDSYTYLLFANGTDIEAFESKMQSVISTNYYDTDGENVLEGLQLQNLTSINLGESISNEIGMVMPGLIVWFLIGFACIIMMIACFNYVSLTIARSLNRGKEVGVRKVLGASKLSIVNQFLVESVLIALIALVFASLLLRWLLPEFNNLFFISFTDNQIAPSLILNLKVVLAFIIFSLSIGIIAGIYPSLYLSSFKPIEVLKSLLNVKGLSGQRLKKIITVGQFSFSIIFITTSIVLFQQFKHMSNTEYGFDEENVINVALQDVPYNQLKYELEKSSAVEVIAASSKIPALGSISGVWTESDFSESRIRAHSFRVDENYLDAMGLNLLAGRNFNPQFSSDSSNAVIISDKSVAQLGFESNKDAIGKAITINEEEGTVVGVVQNFISADPMRKGDPIVFLYRPDQTYYAVVKVSEGRTMDFLKDLDKAWLEFNSLYSVKYRVFDDELRENPLLVIFNDFVKVLALIAGFSIFISCLGLLGMAIYSSQRRVKEIGVRKVLGASVQSIAMSLSKEYLKLIALAILISVPAAWGINYLWLQQVSNKAMIGVEVYLTGAIITTLLAFLTIGSQTLRAARSNPVQNLRSE
ncbi:MAG: ABC transporter permease [Balneola sp.]